jgi:hypothetical protein
MEEKRILLLGVGIAVLISVVALLLSLVFWGIILGMGLIITGFIAIYKAKDSQV